jgi:hypothetical protein
MPIPFWDLVEDVGYEENKARNENPWDILFLNGTRVPGKSAVKVNPKHVIDCKKSTSQDGGPTIARGHEAARVEITITIWTPEQWKDLQVLMESLWRKPGQPLRVKGEAKAIDISHPKCRKWGVTGILIESPSGPDDGPEKGSMVVSLKCIQYIAPPKQKKTDVIAPAKGKGPARLPAYDAALNGGKKPPSETDALARPPVAPRQGDK